MIRATCLSILALFLMTAQSKAGTKQSESYASDAVEYLEAAIECANIALSNPNATYNNIHYSSYALAYFNDAALYALEAYYDDYANGVESPSAVNLLKYANLAKEYANYAWNVSYTPTAYKSDVENAISYGGSALPYAQAVAAGK